MTPQQRSDLYARMNADFLDVMDLIVRKAGEKQREQSLGGNSGSCPAGQVPSGLDASRCDPGRKEGVHD
jgi:hypothetical protein